MLRGEEFNIMREFCLFGRQNGNCHVNKVALAILMHEHVWSRHLSVNQLDGVVGAIGSHSVLCWQMVNVN